MTVSEMLERLSVRELMEWQAYELVHGPIDSTYSENVLASISEQIAGLTRLTGFQFEKNPIPPPKPIVRPHQWFGFGLEDEEPEEQSEKEAPPPPTDPDVMEWSPELDQLMFGKHDRQR